MKKYELDKNDSIEVDGHTLYRVVYTDEFVEYFNKRHPSFTLKKKKGGWIESEKNLSQDDYSVVLNNAKVYGNAEVYGSAIVRECAEIYDNAKVFDESVVCGNARVYGYSIIQNSTIDDDAKVSGDPIIKNSQIGDTVEIWSSAIIKDSNIFGHERVVHDTIILNHV